MPGNETPEHSPALHDSTTGGLAHPAISATVAHQAQLTRSNRLVPSLARDGSTGHAGRNGHPCDSCVVVFRLTFGGREARKLESHFLSKATHRWSRQLLRLRKKWHLETKIVLMLALDCFDVGSLWSWSVQCNVPLWVGKFHRIYMLFSRKHDRLFLF